ncbi:MAG: glycosyltransferase family 2 protein [Pirellulaceae bacterium]|nr:glycosyltransferase family 2 protein [Pirellulaceae bacterium]
MLNEQGSLRELYRRLAETLRRGKVDYELIFVDDGSTDGSWALIQELSRADRGVVGLRLARNFGHEAASTAGLDRATGDAAVLIDADLQDPPELIADMVGAWQGGAKIVYAVRRTRDGEGGFKKLTSWAFYRILRALSDVEIPLDTGDFRLVDRRVLDALKGCRETDRFVRGLVAWTGYRSQPLEYDRAARHSGETKYRPWKLFLLSLDAIVGFSILPLRLASLLGFAVTAASIIMTCIIVVQKLFWGIDIEGYALLASGLFFVGGTQMLLMGVVGEYIARIYRQVQGRPLYLIDEQAGGSGG